MGMSNGEHLLLRACRGEPIERVPVWAMRQAGRWDPEFQKLRGAIPFFAFSEDAERAAAASLCPRRFGVDAIILFYDITTLAIAMGQPFHFQAGQGPAPMSPVRRLADVDRLTDRPDPASYRHITDALRLVRQELAGALPVLVFAGAPFTLGTYQIGTGKEIDQTRRFMSEQPAVWAKLLERTASATARFLAHLRSEGADAFQLFDSWAGALTREEYLAFAHPLHQQIFQSVAGPSILFVKENPYIELAALSGATVLSLGTRHDLAQLSERYPNLVFQGNVDHRLLVTGTDESVRSATRACLRAGGGRRHILNLDHGMDRAAKPHLFASFVAETFFAAPDDDDARR